MIKNDESVSVGGVAINATLKQKLESLESQSRIDPRDAVDAERRRCLALLRGLRDASQMFDDDAYRIFLNAMADGLLIQQCGWCSGEPAGFPCGYCRGVRLEAK